MTGIAFGEQPRWHQDRLWFSDWGPPEVIAVDLEGNSEVILGAPSFPCCVDWLPDGRLLVVSARDGLLLRREPGGSLVTHGDLSRLSEPAAGNGLVVDGRGNAYVNGGGFDLMAGAEFAPRNRRSGHPRWLGPADGRWHRLPQWHGRNAR
jgi:sugar lactone lactonase YvrE